ncbi:hypothetical protein [Brevibacillus porteri]|uniref:hypothetical protein n=1 Tax=Brevibacillus porteri TaxID=2126350 RepID=UPI001ABFC8D5|nr:hypothetical protein [Brevibacillus porteri]MED2747922.1 hypothetical protein [Brevibacillus porteri]MED2816560.1 hypothetical protein [Brevibacillus porteri]MED2897127.1 hypothetical protein [Brevibacillus porteri]MED4899198.1 hypothetical protein [Brevibacillus porteri]
MLKLRTGHEQRQLLEQISLEDSYILYGNIFLRTDRSVVVTDSAQGEVTAIGSYLKGMPFHAFSLHVVEGEGVKNEKGVGKRANQTACRTFR